MQETDSFFLLCLFINVTFVTQSNFNPNFENIN